MLKFHLAASVRVARHFPYREARPRGVLLEIPYEEGDAVSSFHEKLASLAGNGTDNHEGYLVRYDYGGEAYLHFADWKMYVCAGYESREKS